MDIRDWIREQYHEGYTRYQIQEALEQRGYDPALVDEVLIEQKKRVPELPPEIPQEQRKKKHVGMLIGAVVVVAVVIIALFYFTAVINNTITSALSSLPQN